MQLDLPIMSFDLARTWEQLRQEASYLGSDRNARTLVKEHGLRVVLTALRGGARLKEHKAPGPISIQTLAGHIRLRVAGELIDLPAGHMAALDGEVMHDVEAVEESAFLLNMVVA